jgi:hypothetical protein
MTRRPSKEATDHDRTIQQTSRPNLQATRRTRGVTTTPLNDKEADPCDAL